MGLAGTEIRVEVRERPPSQLGQAPLGAVEKARHPQLFRQRAGEGIPGRHGVVHGRRSQGHERDHVDHAEPGMDSLVGAEVEGEDGGGGDGPGRRFSDNRDHGAVMIGVEVHVEQLGAGVAGDQLDDLGSAAFTQIDDALEHDEAVGRGRDRSAGGRKG